ncbi:MAG: FAD:protein FMN transferase [Bacteroidales bacterium]|nr:FAD:protein FMN transferase [Candidatus Liminaster caballi]
MTKKIILLLSLVATIILCRQCLTPKSIAPWQRNQGEVFHTFYHITYQADSDYRPQITQLFREFDGSLSMFNDTSLITRFNRNDTTARANDYFITVFRKGQYVSERTGGAFDMTVAPLVNLWGFGFKNSDRVSQQAVDSILQFVGFQTITLDDSGRIHKQDPRTILDASSIAKGYMSDVVAEFLEGKGVENYMVEIGGEIALHGTNPKGNPWTVGISRPVADSLQVDGDYQGFIQLTSGGVATSGNYRNFYVSGGRRYAHTINPHNGYPIQTDVLSATVIAPDCMTADAFATSFMVLGKDSALSVLHSEPDVEGYLIIPSPTDSTQLEVIYSPGFARFLKSE